MVHTTFTLMWLANQRVVEPLTARPLRLHVFNLWLGMWIFSGKLCGSLTVTFGIQPIGSYKHCTYVFRLSSTLWLKFLKVVVDPVICCVMRKLGALVALVVWTPLAISLDYYSYYTACCPIIICTTKKPSNDFAIRPQHQLFWSLWI